MDKQGKIRLVLALSLVLLIGLSAFAIAKPMLRKQMNVMEIADDRMGHSSPPPRDPAVYVEAMSDGAERGSVTMWERGGTYRVYVHAENGYSQESGIIVDTAQWQLNVPSELIEHLDFYSGNCLHDDSCGRPAADLDFFDGVSGMFEQIWGAGQLSTFMANPGQGAQPSESGYLEYYDFIVHEDAPLGGFDFSLVDLEFYDQSYNLLDSTPTSDFSFEIVPQSCPYVCADLDGSGGQVDLNDFSTFAVCFGAYGPTEACPDIDYSCSDMNGDGWVSLNDFSDFSVLFGTVPTTYVPDCLSPLMQSESDELFSQFPEDATLSEAVQILQL